MGRQEPWLQDSAIATDASQPFAQWVLSHLGADADSAASSLRTTSDAQSDTSGMEQLDGSCVTESKPCEQKNVDAEAD
jgi:hypothetical protein